MNSSHPSPSRQELVGRATKLAVTFAERRVATAEARQISDESIADMQEAGFFRMLQPRRWHELLSLFGFALLPPALRLRESCFHQCRHV